MFFQVLFLISNSYKKVAKPLKHHLNFPAKIGKGAPPLVANNGQWLSLPF